MGAVYEADEIESGRRVALKVLKERLHDPRERERFHREGRLAASLNHPHCVFVFAASEIDGRLAIAMELMEGTLADRLKTHGPLPAAEAVDATLQLLLGLQAASAIGILHRDVKPSNCFVGADGVVKIGDFGISRSLRLTEETAFSTRTRFAATPAYASPEQLRGATLDTRADVYSLGATLYELLTGRPPFERDDLMALLMAVANDAPEPPHARVSAIPTGLSQVVLRCLAKQPDQRFTDYDALAAALAPFSSTAATPATVGRRFFAGVVDLAAVSFLHLPLVLAALGGSLTPVQKSRVAVNLLIFFLSVLVYFSTTEGIWAASPGKALMRLTLVDSNGRPPRTAQVVARAALYALVWTLGGLVWLLVWPVDGEVATEAEIDLLQRTVTAATATLWAALFSTARRRNGYAGLHDLATGTRVVVRSLTKARRSEGPALAVTVPHTTLARLGPFEVTAGTVPGLPATWRPGVDERLRRSVWIRQVTPGTPPIEAARLAVSRPTRLRWLAGRRELDEAWDVFEAVPGVPLEQACARPRAWADVRWWLLDLARECASQTPQETAPLRADRVWVLDSCGAKLVDDPTADRASRAARGPEVSCAALLSDVVRTARGSSVDPWPLGAQRFIDGLRAEPPPGPSSIARELESLSRQRAVLTPGWRALHVVALAAIPLLLSGSNALWLGYQAIDSRQVPLEARIVSRGLEQLRRADQGPTTLSPQDREAIEVFLASRYRVVLTDPRMNTYEFWFAGSTSPDQLERVLRRLPTEEEGHRASGQAVVRAIVEDAASNTSDSPPVTALTITTLTFDLALVAGLSLLTALAFRGGLMRIMGLELVTADGRPATRLRVLARAALVWAPSVALVILARFLIVFGVRTVAVLTVGGLALLILLVGAIVAVLHPSRGIQDRLAGTWIVPR